VLPFAHRAQRVRQHAHSASPYNAVVHWFAWLVVLAGCDQVFGLQGLPESDELCIGRNGPAMSGWFSTCLQAPPPAQLAGQSTIDSDADCSEVITNEGGEVCIVAAYDIAIYTKLATKGRRPLVLASIHSFEIGASGGISVASHRGQDNGAGSDFKDCPMNINGNNASAQSGGAGAAGGSFQTIGGQGGRGDGNLAHAAPRPEPEPAFVRGGCRGGVGGNGSIASGGGAGASGGALYLVAGSELVIDGVLNASGEAAGGGAGGSAGTSGGAGGGGGGSGGLIGIDAPRVIIGSTATLVANGGPGGGAGSSTQSGANGTESDPATVFPFPSSGGAGGSSNAGGPGGAGAVRDIPAAAGGDTAGLGGGGGGGGGGGAGFIKVFATQLEMSPTALFTPPPT